MAYESFYGGRQGASFVIVAKYKTIADMIAVFEQGGATVDQVNYGEYVLIDTENKNNPENGCVYRRGMNYQDSGTPYDPANPRDYYLNPGHGAEYIGQIVGPEGSIKEFRVDNYNPDAAPSEFVGGGIGEYDSSEMNSGKSSNVINYSQQNVVDDQGHIIEYLIGFKFTYYEQEQESTSVDPYYIGPIIEDQTPLDDTLPYDPETNAARQADRPFYRKYKLSIPRGFKGDSIKQACSVPTSLKAGTTIYLTASTSGELSDIDRVLDTNLSLPIGKLIDYELTRNKGYIQQKEGPEGEEVNKYAYLTGIVIDSWHEGFLVCDYEESEQGKDHWMDGGNNSYIAEIVISDGSDISFNKPNYLLVYFSDPGMRKALPAEQRVTYKGKSDQLNLGYVKGEPGNSPIMGRIYSLDELYVQDLGQSSAFIKIRNGSIIYNRVSEEGELSNPDRELTADLTLLFSSLVDQETTRDKKYVQQKESGVDKYAYLNDVNSKKPEEVGGNPSYKGQVVTLDIGGENDQVQAYDYLHINNQYKVGTFGGGSGNGFIISDVAPELDDGGVQGKTELIYCN